MKKGLNLKARMMPIMIEGILIANLKTKVVYMVVVVKNRLISKIPLSKGN